MKKEDERNVGFTESEYFQAMENLQEIQRLPSVSPINLNYFGSEQCMPGYTFGPFVRTSYVLHLIRSGHGRFTARGKVYSLHAGQAFLICPGEKTVYQADQADPWHYMWVGFHGLQAKEMMQRAGFSPDQPVMTCKSIDRLVRIMENLLKAKELTYENDMKRMGYLYLLIGELISNNATPEKQIREDQDTENLYVKTAVDLLINSQNLHMKVNDIARAIGISRGYLTSIFKNQMGISPQEFQMNFRMERAGNLLRSTDNPVGTIAAELGYTDVMSFSKSFRRHFGVSPTQYREQKVVLVTGGEKGSYTSEHPL